MAFILILPFKIEASTDDLQSLVDEADAGDVITFTGEYEGDIFIDKPVTIDGEGEGKITGSYESTPLIVEADDVTVKNMEIKGSTRSRNTEQEGSCVRNRGDDNIYESLVLSECFHGIYLNSGDGTIVENNDIQGYPDGSRGEKGYGLYVKKANENQILDNYIHTFRDGIYFEYSHDNLIEGNRVTDTRYGLHYMYSNFNEFYDNDFVANVGGAAIMQSDNILLSNNTFSYNQGTQAFGLIVQTSRNIEIIDNEFLLNQRGLYIEGSTLTEIENNTFFNNEIGVELWSSSTEQYFYDNDFISNNVQVTMVGNIDQHYFSKNEVGNYWGEPLLDLNQNSIGDDPYVYSSSIGNLIEQNELSYLFIKSPAMAIQDNASRLFGMFDNAITDEHPQTRGQEISYVWFIAAAGTALLIIILITWKKRRVIK